MRRAVSFLVFSAICAAPAVAQDWALRLESGGRYEFPHDPVMLTGKEFTFEAWVRSTPTSNGLFVLCQRYAGSAEHKSVTIYPDGSLDFIYAGSPWPGQVTAPGTFPMDNQFHHVAAVRYADDTWKVFVDGGVVLAGGPGPCWLTCNIIGTTTVTTGFTDSVPGNAWDLRAVHFAAGAIYAAPFVPPAAFPVDFTTVLNAPLEEGGGTQVHDIGNVGQVGVLKGNTSWVSTTCKAPEYGAGCADGDGMVPHLSMLGCPGASQLTLELSQAAPQRAGVVLLGAFEASIPAGGPCLLLVTPVFPTVVTFPTGGTAGVPGSGGFAAPIPVPTDFPPATVRLQAFVADPLHAWGYSASNGVSVSVP